VDGRFPGSVVASIIRQPYERMAPTRGTSRMHVEHT